MGVSRAAGGAVGRGGPRGDHVQRVPQHVAEDDAVHPGRGAGQGEPSALDGGQPLADGVHLHDAGPAGQQLAGDVLQLCAGQQGLFQQGAAPARQKEQDGVPLTGAFGQVQGGLGGPERVLVRHRVPRLVAGNAGDLPLHMAVLGHHHPGIHAAKGLDGGAGHGPGGFAGGHQQHPAGKALPLQRTAHRLVGQDGGNGGADDGFSVGAQVLVHRRHFLSDGAFTAKAGRAPRSGCPPPPGTGC